ncbi:MAG: shikimate kinase [Nitrospirae bacterium]|nr:MAG: shikimate kinase [Nitrospirota bacterium]
MNLVLIGYRGTGKSTVASLVARQLNWPVVSTDAEIVRRMNRPIPEIVATVGWDVFRQVETEVCRELQNRDQLVIDTGGGIVTRQENIEALKPRGVVFWLTASIPTIVARIGGDTQRPSLTGSKSFTEEVAEVLAERLPQYQAAADHVVETDNTPAEQVADRILAVFRQRC